jgi:glycosyltransferase involved in cell wall biosynthesis
MPTPTLVTAMLTRNEAAPDRYLRRVLARCREFSDDIVVLDDGSTDDTPKIAAGFGALVVPRIGDEAAWGHEAPARAALWEHAARRAGPDGWVLVCDADMLLEGDPRPLTLSWAVSAWAWTLRDCWDDEAMFRVDGAWGAGPVVPRPWLFRPSALTEPALWPARGVHCGHAPVNFPASCGIAPASLYWRHLGWLNREHRVRKAAQYAAVAGQLTEFERAHAASILDA